MMGAFVICNILHLSNFLPFGMQLIPETPRCGAQKNRGGSDAREELGHIVGSKLPARSRLLNDIRSLLAYFLMAYAP